ncbi:MAG: site-2 protease family protein [Lyngbya sp. HA4199-MV5]|jgi:membrane-associated protease RseP (regulator of RpoE activity)|nr:site-2 protease family protein [Lyngbya sp. HA4199-MV5]
MNPLILLFLLGLITYFIVQRVANVTRSPVWLLWLVAMAPAIVSSGWVLAKGKPMPSETILILSAVCLLVYWFLIQRNRISPPPVNSTAAEGQEPPAEVPKESVNLPATPRPIDKAEETSLQNCFPWSVYYLQNVEYRPQAVICRGQLRSKPEVAYQTIQENVAEAFGDRFYLVFQEGTNQKPFFVLVPNPQAQAAADAAVPGVKPRKEVVSRPLLAIGLFIATFFTTTLAWLDLEKKAVQLSPTTLATGLPYALALMTILGIHELGHYLTARRYKIKATLPYFIPVIPIPLFPFGTFGAFIQIRSPIPNRRALFDVGIAGPIAGFVVALPLLLWGLAHSEVVRLPEKFEVFNFQALDPSFSILLALLSKLALGNALTDGFGVHLHPVAVAGVLGLVVTAFNLMPVGQLDGGHIVHAMFGQRVGAAIGQVSRLLLLTLSLVQPHLLVWAILLFLMPATDEPALNDVTELDDRRDLWGILALGLLVLIILPMPAGLATLLRI